MPLLIAASIVAAGASFACTPTRVWDGDGPVWYAEGPHVRLAGIAAREMDGTSPAPTLARARRAMRWSPCSAARAGSRAKAMSWSLCHA